MELKKAPGRYDETPNDIELNDMFDTLVDETLSQTISDDKKHISDDYSRSGTNTTYVGGKIAEYDEKIEKNAFRMSEEDMKKALSKTAHEKKEQNSKLLLFTGIIMYLAFAFFIFTLFLASRVAPYDIIYNMENVSLAFMILSIILVADSILAFVLEERKAGLILFAIFLGMFYPIYRSKVINGRLGFGIVCTLLALFAWVMVGITAGQAVTKYGKTVIYTEDEYTRHEAVALLEQEDESGKLVGFAIKNLENKGIEEIKASSEGGNAEIVMSGTGPKDVNINTDNFNNPNGIHVDMTFEKNTKTGKYDIKDISFDGKSITDAQRKQLWKTLMK